MTPPVPGLLFDTTFASAPAGARARPDVPEVERWNLADIFPSWDAWREAYDDLERRVQAYGARKGTLAGGAAVLLDALRESDTMGQLAYKVWYFASLTHDEDQRDNQIGGQTPAGATAVRPMAAVDGVVQPRGAGAAARHVARLDGWRQRTWPSTAS